MVITSRPHGIACGNTEEGGTSALLMVVRKSTPDKVLEALKPYGGTVLQTSLTHDDEEKLAEALSAAS